MALVGNDFLKMPAVRKTRCSECGRVIELGKTCLESIRNGKVQKRICSERCRLRFDDRYWQERADERDRR